MVVARRKTAVTKVKTMNPQLDSYIKDEASSESTQSTMLVESKNMGKLMGTEGKVKSNDWGFPGYLTKSEYDVLLQFGEIVSERAGAFRNAVFAFGEVEEDAYAYCRWLRARKFSLKDTIKLVDEAVECRKDASRHHFYPDPNKALGVEKSFYLSQYPQLYCPPAKNGCPVFISQPGVLNVVGLECVTTMEAIFKFHWWSMIHELGYHFQAQARSTSNFKRFEAIYVVDLANLSANQISRRALNIVKVQTAIDSICFPETLNKMLVVNAPSFFSMTWKLISSWIDERTSAKVEIISSRKKSENRLRELIDINYLPSDYGGLGLSTKEILERDLQQKKVEKCRIFSKTILLRSFSSFEFTLENETMKPSIFTRSLPGANFSIYDKSKKLLTKTNVIHKGSNLDTEVPTRVNLDSIQGPGKFVVKIESYSSSLSTNNFLFIGSISRKNTKLCETKERDNMKVTKIHADTNYCISNKHVQHTLETTTLSYNEIKVVKDDKITKNCQESTRVVSNMKIPQVLQSVESEYDMEELERNLLVQIENEEEQFTPWLCGGVEGLIELLNSFRSK